MADKETKLSIVLRTVDEATAKIKAVNARLDAITKPTRDFGKALGELREKSGLDDVIGGFKGVGSAIGDLLGKVAMIGGVAGLAVAGLFHLVNEFDELGDKAERFGVSVDFLAQMRYAAEKAGAPVEDLDNAMSAFSVSLGKARAGTGRMAAFLQKVNPDFLKQLKGAKSNAEAFDDLATAMSKLTDPAKRAALATATLGTDSLAPLFAKGPKGIKELRERFLELAGSQEDAADKAGAVDDSMHDLHASMQGVKAAILSGLAPALKIIVDQLSKWFSGHREDVKEWAESLGKKLPAAFNAVVDAISTAIDVVRPFVDSSTKLKVILGVVAAVILGPLVSSVYALGVALLTTPVGWIVAGIAALGVAAYELIKHWDAVTGFFSDLWSSIKETFGSATDLVLFLVAPFIAVPAMIIEHWDDITGFFGDLWDGVTGVFKDAWDFIKGIVDKIVGAVNTVVDGAETIGRKLGFGGGNGNVTAAAIGAAGDLSSRSQQLNAATAGLPSQAAKIIVDFANAPRGTRATTDPSSTADVDLSMGYQMLGFGS